MRVSTIDIETRPLYLWEDSRLPDNQRLRLLKRAFKSLTGQSDWQNLSQELLDLGAADTDDLHVESSVLNMKLKGQLRYSERIIAGFINEWVNMAEGYMSVDAQLCEIVSIGETIMEKGKDPYTKLYCYDDKMYNAFVEESKDNDSDWHQKRTWDEATFASKKDVLEEFRYSILKSNKIFGWRIRRFDNPILMNRFAEVGLEVPQMVPNRFNLSWIVDLNDVVSMFGNSPSPINFDSLCLRLGIESPKQEMNGGDILQAYKDGKYFEICQYQCIDCSQEAKAAKALYKQYGKIIESFNRR